MSDGGSIEARRRDLVRIRGALVAVVGATAEGVKPVDLEEPIGRISRVDAIQQQKMLAENRQAAQRRRRQVEAALGRIEDGEYGAYYIADEQGVEEKFTQAIFDTHFKLNIDMFQPRNIRMLAIEFGIDKEISSGFESKKIKAKVEKALALATQNNANETPTVIVNGVLKVTPSMVGGSTAKMTDNLEIIFDDILKQ